MSFISFMHEFCNEKMLKTFYKSSYLYFSLNVPEVKITFFKYISINFATN